MKYLKLTIALVFIWTKSYSQVQPPTITVGAFENDTIKNFNTVNDFTQSITNELIKKGFKVQVLKNSGIDKIKQINATKNYAELNLDSSTSTINYYSSINGMESENGMLLIKLIKGTEERTLTLIVETVAAEVVNIQQESTTDCNRVKNYDNKFGEEARYYDGNKIVYVYDFNKDPSKREFYKITRKNEKELKKLASDTERNGHKGLNIQVVNFNKETLNSGKNVKFKIYNINKFLYDVSIADSVIHFDSEPSALFTSFFLGDSTLLGSLMGSFSDKNLAQANEKTKELLEAIKKFINDYNDLRKTALDALNPCHEFTCCNDNYDYKKFLAALSNIKAQEENVKRKLNEEKNDPIKKECNEQIKFKAKAEYGVKTLNFAISKLNLHIAELTSENSTLSNNIYEINDEIKLIESQVFFSNGADSLTKTAQLLRLKTEYTAKINDLKASQLELSKHIKDRDSLDIKSFEFATSIDSIKNNISQKCKTADGKTDVQDMIDALEASDYLLSHLPTEDDLKKLIVFINNLVVQNNSYTSDYISLNGNMLDLTIKIASKDSIFKYFSLPEYKNDPLQIQIPIVGKPFVSFSSGSFIALGKNMQNKTYAWQETVGNNNIVDSSKYTLVESGYTLPPMGFCALGNLEWKLSRSFGLGGSAGVGLSIEKSPRLAYLGGVSLFFGDMRQFTITGGFAGMQVNKLSNNFQTVSDNQTIYSSKPNIDYYKEFKVGGFISLTYTPFKVYKTKTVKSKNK